MTIVQIRAMLRGIMDLLLLWRYEIARRWRLFVCLGISTVGSSTAVVTMRYATEAGVYGLWI